MNKTNEKAHKKKKKKKESNAAEKREPFMLELASLVQALEVCLLSSISP